MKIFDDYTNRQTARRPSLKRMKYLILKER